MINTTVNIAGVELKNPIMTASGTFGSGEEYSEFVDLNKLGAVVTYVFCSSSLFFSFCSKEEYSEFSRSELHF